MDFSLISQAGSAITVAKEFTKAALGLRDFNEMAAALSQINEQLLKAQDALFSHNSNLHQLQQEHFEALEKLRTMEKLLSERGRYSLFEISKGVFVYRLNPGQNVCHDGNPVLSEPDHYVCQPCFDKGIKVVLIRQETATFIGHKCPACEVIYLELKKPQQPIRPMRSTWMSS